MAEYFYLGERGRFQGPLTRNQLDALARQGAVSDWTPIRVTGRESDVRYWDLPPDHELPDEIAPPPVPEEPAPQAPAGAAREWTPPAVPATPAARDLIPVKAATVGSKRVAQPSKVRNLNRLLTAVAEEAREPSREWPQRAVPEKGAKKGFTPQQLGCGCVGGAIGLIIIGNIIYHYPWLLFVGVVAIIAGVAANAKK